MTGVIPAQFLKEDPIVSKSVMKRLEAQCDYLFVYGILKRGFVLDLSFANRAEFIDEAMLPGAILYRVGGGVGLRFTEDQYREVYGEVFKIPQPLWKWLDSIESNGFSYTRRIVEVGLGNPEGPDYGWVKAWVYEHTYPGMKYDKPILDGVYRANIRV